MNNRPDDHLIAPAKYANTTPRPLYRYANEDPPHPCHPTRYANDGTNKR
jgi:hypothetical protein